MHVLGGLWICDEVSLFLPVRFYWVRRARWFKLHGRKKAEEEAQVAAQHDAKTATVA